MPGISQECESGLHEACTMGFQCRCFHHTHTQELMKAGPAKPSGKGGIRRNLKKTISAAVAGLPQPPGLIEETEDLSEVKNACPKCKTEGKPTDIYCRKDGTKLCKGVPCEQCTAACEEKDVHCWNCGWKLGEAVPRTPEPSPLPTPGLRLDLTPSLPPGAEELLQPGRVEVLAAEPPPAEDPIRRLRRMATEQGLLKETTIS